METRSENRSQHPPAQSQPVASNPSMYSQGPLQYCVPGHFGPFPNEDMSHHFGNFNMQGYNASHIANQMFPMQHPGGFKSAGTTFYSTRDGRIFAPPPPPAMYTIPQAGHYIPHPSQQVHNATNGVGWNSNQMATKDNSVPELAAPRRSSSSSNDEASPHTPFFPSAVHADVHPKVTVTDSPVPWATPSPHQLNGAFLPQQLAKTPNGRYIFVDLDAVCMQEPAIPKPVPAIFSGEKGRGTLKKSLQNTLNTTNVYIRGLHPNTTDEMLYSYGRRFGAIISAKSMLEQDTGACKGFGFIKYHNFDDGENCIRAFFHWGYEAKWARVSHNEKLKTLGDENNTNLYVSNLPLDFNEATLMSTFKEHEVLSAKILRDANGMSRGVGFARFATPEICRHIIEQYNGKKISDDGATLSVRFADTPEQKKLKSITAERRQFKTNEYNTAVYSPGSPYLVSSPATATFPSPLQSRFHMGQGGSHWSHGSASPLYPNYSAQSHVYQLPHGVLAVSQRHSSLENIAPESRRSAIASETPKLRQRSNSVKLERSNSVKLESPSTSILAKRPVGSSNVPSPVKSEGATSRYKVRENVNIKKESSPLPDRAASRP